MACIQTLAGIGMDCVTSLGGIKKVYIANYVDNAFTVNDGVVTGISASVDWYQYNFKKNTGSMTSTLNIDTPNGINYVSTELVLQFTKMETVKRVEIASLALADLIVVVEDYNGERFALGVSEPVLATSGTGQTGTAKGDGNYYQITLTDEHTEFPPILSKSVVITPEN